MKRGLLISFYIVALALACAALLPGCSALPSMQYCDQVEYTRDGSVVHIEATCRAPVGGGLPGL